MRDLLIALGAGIGAPLRYVIGREINRIKPTVFPIATLAINILGSFVLGLLIHNHGDLRYIFGIGFAGAFTTWSTFAVEVHNLIHSKKSTTAFSYLVLTIVLGASAASFGVHLVN
jgi:CrcB protein